MVDYVHAKYEKEQDIIYLLDMSGNVLVAVVTPKQFKAIFGEYWCDELRYGARRYIQVPFLTTEKEVIEWTFA